MFPGGYSADSMEKPGRISTLLLPLVPGDFFFSWKGVSVSVSFSLKRRFVLASLK